MTRFLKLATVASFLLTASLNAAFAQTPAQARIVTACGTPGQTYTPGKNGAITQDNTGKLCVNASVSASISGFAPNGSYATLSATGSSADVALPTNTGSVLAHNSGTTAVSCVLAIGAGTATASKILIQPASWIQLTVGSNTHIACIDQTGSTANTVVIVGGDSGLAAGSGGGGGGGGGGAVTIADGADVNSGATTDAAATAGSTGTLAAKLRLMTTQLDNINTNVQTGAATNGATYPGSSIGIGWKDGSGNIQPFAAATPAPIAQYRGTTALVADPCQANTPTIKPFSITTATTTNIVTGTTGKKLYVCYLYMQTTAANNIAVISGTTGATCGANTAALVGGITAANGLNDAANSGQAFGKGDSAVMQVLTNNDDICIITSAATPLAGLIKYVVQ